MAKNSFAVGIGHTVTIESNDELAETPSIKYSEDSLQDNKERFRFHLDEYKTDPTAKSLRIRGWAFAPFKTYEPVAIFFGLFNGEGYYLLPISKEIRPDVAGAYNLGSDFVECGYSADLDLASVPNGSYDAFLVIENAREMDFSGNEIGGDEVPTQFSIARYLKGLAGRCPRVSKVVRQASNLIPSQRQLCDSIDSLEELDKRLDRMMELTQRDPQGWFLFAQTFRFDDKTGFIDTDPLSEAYRSEQMALYHRLAGKGYYVATESEPIALDVSAQLDPHPFPFDSRNPDHIGNHLFNLAGIFKAIDKKPPATVLEYGMGSGFTSLHLAAAGFNVVGVDINKDCVDIARRVAKGRGITNLRTEIGEFGDVPEGLENIEVVLFYESFHHCWEFDRVLARLHEITAPNCSLVFGNEPVYDDFPKPWGLRTDGQSLFEIRTKGWLELGFRTDFFRQVLDETGWTVEALFEKELMSPVFLAHKKGA